MRSEGKRAQCWVGADGVVDANEGRVDGGEGKTFRPARLGNLVQRRTNPRLDPRWPREGHSQERGEVHTARDTRVEEGQIEEHADNTQGTAAGEVEGVMRTMSMGDPHCLSSNSFIATQDSSQTRRLFFCERK